MGTHTIKRFGRKDDGSVVEIVETRGNYGSAHADDGSLKDPAFFSTFQTLEGVRLEPDEQGGLQARDGSVRVQLLPGVEQRGE